MATPDKDTAAEGSQDGTSVRLEFGRRARELRKAKGYSQERFAAASGLDRSYYGAVERGERNVSLENIAVIAETLGVPIKELFTSEATPGS
jgi:transcriptional regulator with XRE-family HTH domain